MAAPWEKYAAPAQGSAPPPNAAPVQAAGPWAKYSAPETPPVDPPPGEPVPNSVNPMATLGRAAIGAADLIYSGATGAVAAIPAAVAYGGAAVAKAAGADVDPAAVQSRVQNYFTQQPMSDSGRGGAAALGAGARAVGNALDVPEVQRAAGDFTNAVEQRSPVAGSMLRAVPGAFQAASAIVPAVAGARAAATAPLRLSAPAAAPAAVAAPAAAADTAEGVLAAQAAKSQQNMGAFHAAPSLATASPELKAAIVETARKNGGAINPEALQRYVDADAVFRGSNAKLSEGQALQDVTLLSHERNMRGAVPQFAQQFNEQNGALRNRLQTIRDEAGPDVFSANHVEHGDTLINAYKAVDTAREGEVTQAYNALRAAAGGNFPIGANTLLSNASKELHAKLIIDHAPKSVMNQLKTFAETPGSMTFENFEAMRTNLATIQRTATDGLERKAAGIIRQAMEDLPLVPGAAKLKPLADKARKLARDRFAAIEADPAYAAAIEGSVPPDRFVQKFVTGGTRDDLAKMAATVGHDDSARQTMGVAALDYLRDQARLSPNYEGNFAAKSYNKALTKLGPGMVSLLPPNVVEQLEQLGRVAGYTTGQPEGAFVNNSGTFVAAAADHAKSTAEGVANTAAAGVPVGTWIRKSMEGASNRRSAKRAFDPRAGLGTLRAQDAPQPARSGAFTTPPPAGAPRRQRGAVGNLTPPAAPAEDVFPPLTGKDAKYPFAVYLKDRDGVIGLAGVRSTQEGADALKAMILRQSNGKVDPARVIIKGTK